MPIHRDTRIDLKIVKGGVVVGHNKKEENRKPRKKGNRKPEAKESVYQGFSLEPIYMATRIDLKTEMGGVVKRHNK